MKPEATIEQEIDRVGQSLAQALGEGVICIAVYGSAAGEEFSPGHSDVNLLIVLSEVTFADLELIGATLGRDAPAGVVFATPLVITPAFLRDARDSFPIELNDIRRRHRLLSGQNLLSSISVKRGALREAAEREARSRLLRLRSLVMHSPPDEEMQHALAGLVSVLSLIERSLLSAEEESDDLQGTQLLAAVEEQQGVSLPVLARLQRMRDGAEPWPTGGDLRDLTAGCLKEVEALVSWVDAHAGESLARAAGR